MQHMVFRGLPTDPRYNPARDLAHCYTNLLQSAETLSYDLRKRMPPGIKELSDDELYQIWSKVAQYLARLELGAKTTGDRRMTTQEMLNSLSESGWMDIPLEHRYLVCAAIGQTLFSYLPAVIADLHGMTPYLWPRRAEDLANDAKEVQKRWTRLWFRYEIRKRINAVCRSAGGWWDFVVGAAGAIGPRPRGSTPEDSVNSPS